MQRTDVDARLASGCLTVSLVLFAVSLALPGYAVPLGQRIDHWPGWALLLMGWVTVMAGTPAWLGNPLLLVAWVLFAARQFRAAAIASLLAVATMLSFLGNTQVLTSSLPAYSPIAHRGLGYWLWLASGVELLAASIWLLQRERRTIVDSAEGGPERPPTGGGTTFTTPRSHERPSRAYDRTHRRGPASSPR